MIHLHSQRILATPQTSDGGEQGREKRKKRYIVMFCFRVWRVAAVTWEKVMIAIKEEKVEEKKKG